MLCVIGISGSPSAASRTERLTDYVLDLLAERGVSVGHIRVREIPSDALLRADSSDPGLAEAIATVAGAHGVIVATPIFKASCSGLLKAFLDTLPQFAFAGKAVMPLATGGSLAHVLALDYSVRPILQSMAPRHIIQSYFVPESAMRIDNDQVLFNSEGVDGLMPALSHFIYSLDNRPEASELGHPRPDHIRMRYR